MRCNQFITLHRILHTTWYQPVLKNTNLSHTNKMMWIQKINLCVLTRKRSKIQVFSRMLIRALVKWCASCIALCNRRFIAGSVRQLISVQNMRCILSTNNKNIVYYNCDFCLNRILHYFHFFVSQLVRHRRDITTFLNVLMVKII